MAVDSSEGAPRHGERNLGTLERRVVLFEARKCGHREKRRPCGNADDWRLQPHPASGGFCWTSTTQEDIARKISVFVTQKLHSV